MQVHIKYMNRYQQSVDTVLIAVQNLVPRRRKTDLWVYNGDRGKLVLSNLSILFPLIGNFKRSMDQIYWGFTLLILWHFENLTLTNTFPSNFKLRITFKERKPIKFRCRYSSFWTGFVILINLFFYHIHRNFSYISWTIPST